MAISDAQFTAWLSKPDAIRCILVEITASVSTVETTRFLSSKNYIDESANVTYEPVLLGNSVRVIRRLSIKGESSLVFGDIEIINLDGTRDSWLDDVWANRVCLVVIGDPRWERSDFRTILNGITEDIDSKSNSTLNFKIRDKLQRLNTPITETRLGGLTKNSEEILPLTFGEVHNATPLLVNPSTLQYQVHQSDIEGIIEVRDEGVPVVMVELPASDGTFKLAASPYGKITCSTQGDKEGGSTYHTTIAKIIERIVTGYGEPTNRFVAADLDAANLAAFDTANPDPVGIYASGGGNVLSMISSLARSVGAQLAMSTIGELQLIKIELPAPGSPVLIGESDIIMNTLSIAIKVDVQAAQKIAFNKNWTVQEKLDTNIPAFHSQMFGQKWLTIVSEDAAVKSTYRQDAEPRQIETMLLREVEAQPEADRLRDLYKVPRFVMVFKAVPRLIELELGQAVTLTHPRFGLSSGKAGMVVGLSIDWSNLLVDVEVMV